MPTKRKLIDANKIPYHLSGFPKGDGFDSGLDWAFREDIEKLPTVDAVEVVHGEWANPYMNRYGHPCHCCSVCGFKASYQDKNYCPNCGAKMDGDSRKESEA